jgi:hypothetical protein
LRERLESACRPPTAARRIPDDALRAAFFGAFFLADFFRAVGFLADFFRADAFLPARG